MAEWPGTPVETAPQQWPGTPIVQSTAGWPGTPTEAATPQEPTTGTPNEAVAQRFGEMQPPKVGLMDIARQAGKDILNIVPSMLHLPQAAGEASEAWRLGERTPEAAGTMLGAAAPGLKLGGAPFKMERPAVEPPVAEVGRNSVTPPPPPGFEMVRMAEPEILPPERYTAAPREEGYEPTGREGFTPSQMKRLLDDEQQSVVNMWAEAKEFQANPRPVGETRASYLQRIERDMKRDGLWDLPSEDAVAQTLMDRRLAGKTVKATRAETVNANPRVVQELPAPRTADLGAAASGVKEPLPPVTKPEVAAVADDLNRLRQSGVADRAEIAQRMEATPPEFKDPALQERLYNAIENPAEMAKLSPPERALFDQYIQPMRDELTQLYNKVKQYGGEDMVADPTYVHRIAKGHAPVYDTLSGDAADPITGTRGLNRTTSALQGRKFFALQDEAGNRFVVSKGDGASTIWTNGKPTRMTTELELRPGTEVSLGGKTFDVKQATTNEIETNSDVRYHKSAAVNTADALVRMREVARNIDYLEKVKSDLFDQGRAVRVVGNRPVPNGFVETKIPQLRGWAFDPKIAAAFDDFYKPGFDVKSLEGLRKLNRFATASMFYTPLPHIENVAWHWYTARGFDWVRPGPVTNFVKDATRAIKEVVTQGPEYQRLLREGNGVVYGGIKQSRFYENLGKQFGMETERHWGDMKPIFDKLGFVGKNAYELTAWWYDKMRNSLWAANDMFMLHRVFELERKGMTTRQAIKEAEKHIPNYRVPSEVLNSRLVSQIMQETAFLNFMRYHYGQWASYAHQFTDLIKGGRQEGTGASQRVEALGSMIATGFGLLVIIPTLNYILQKLTGDPNAKKLMRGSLSIPDMALKLALGDKTGGESASNVVTPAPVTKEILQQTYDTDWFSKNRTGGFVPRAEHAAKIYAPYNVLAQATDSNPGARTAGRFAFDTLVGAENTSERTRSMKEYFKARREKEDERRYERPTGPLTKGYKAAKDYVSKAYQDYKGP